METNNGYPSIDSLKAISKLFGVSIDDLISDDDVENKRLLDERRAKLFYYIAMIFLGITVIFTLLAYFLKQPYFNIGSFSGVVGYVVFGLLSKPKYKRTQLKKLIVPYIISRIVILFVILGVIIYSMLAF